MGKKLTQSFFFILYLSLSWLTASWSSYSPSTSDYVMQLWRGQCELYIWHVADRYSMTLDTIGQHTQNRATLFSKHFRELHFQWDGLSKHANVIYIRTHNSSWLFDSDKVPILIIKVDLRFILRCSLAAVHLIGKLSLSVLSRLI